MPVAEDISTTEYISGTNYKEPTTITGNYGTDCDALSSSLTMAECEDIDGNGIIELSDFEAELKNNYKAMAESVNKYDGFYVGRFETSMNGSNPQSKRSTYASGSGELIESATAAGNTWYDLYALNKKYSTSSVQGSMIWGIQYDKMMSWMVDAANTTISGYNTNRTCGTAPDDVIKNVYDLYGNSSEWTVEAYDTYYRVWRGGNYQGNVTPKSRFWGAGTMPNNGAASGTGSRLALYIV